MFHRPEWLIADGHVRSYHFRPAAEHGRPIQMHLVHRPTGPVVAEAGTASYVYQHRTEYQERPRCRCASCREPRRFWYARRFDHFFARDHWIRRQPQRPSPCISRTPDDSWTYSASPMISWLVSRTTNRKITCGHNGALGTVPEKPVLQVIEVWADVFMSVVLARF